MFYHKLFSSVPLSAFIHIFTKNHNLPVRKDIAVMGPQSCWNFIRVSSYLILCTMIWPDTRPTATTSTAGACKKKKKNLLPEAATPSKNRSLEGSSSSGRPLYTLPHSPTYLQVLSWTTADHFHSCHQCYDKSELTFISKKHYSTYHYKIFYWINKIYILSNFKAKQFWQKTTSVMKLHDTHACWKLWIHDTIQWRP